MSLPKNVIVRDETPADIDGIRSVERAAFGRDNEADLVDSLRGSAVPFLSLVAVSSGQVVGHVLFTRVAFAPPRDSLSFGLAPLAVDPGHRGKGIGTALVEAGLARLREMGCGVVVVLGDPEYYGRFGFQPASSLGLRCGFDAPPEACMALTLGSAYVPQHGSATILYRPEFDDFD